MGRRRGGLREPSRQALAFSALLEDEDGMPVRRNPATVPRPRGQGARRERGAPGAGAGAWGGCSPGHGGSPPGGSPPTRAGAGVPGFPGYAQARRDEAMGSLLEMFGARVDPEVVAQVLALCGGDAARAADALLPMAAPEPADAPRDADLIFGELEGAPAGQPAGGEARGPAGGDAPGPAGGGPGGGEEAPWHSLPADLKLEIFSKLTVREAALAAPTCRDFALLASALRGEVSTLDLPAAAVAALLRGDPGPVQDSLVAHPEARAVRLSGAAKKAARGAGEAGAFEALFRALAEADALRQSRAAAYGRLGSRSALGPSPYLVVTRRHRRGSGGSPEPAGPPPAPPPPPPAAADDYSASVGVEAVDLRGCDGLSDLAVASLCEELPGVRELRVSNCALVGDGALMALSRYEGMSQAERDAVRSLELPFQSPGSRGGAGAGGAAPAGAPARGPAAVAATPGLRVLLAAGCRAVTDAGVRSLLQGPVSRHSLTTLDLSRCPRVTGDALPAVAQCRALESVKLNNCPGLHRAVLQLPAGHPLREVSLSGCPNLTQVVVVADRLTAVNVSACKRLGLLDLRCPRLRTLLAAQCPGLESLYPAALHGPAVAPGPSVIPTPAALGDLLGHFARLAELNVANCRSLRTSPLLHLLASAPRLALLDLHGCLDVSQLTVRAAAGAGGAAGADLAWRRLDVSGCKRLERIHVEARAPGLAEFAASGCGALASVRLPSGALATVDVTNCGALVSWADAGGGAPAGGPPAGAPVAPTHAVTPPVAMPGAAGRPPGGEGAPARGGLSRAWGGRPGTPEAGSHPDSPTLLGASPAVRGSGLGTLLARFNAEARRRHGGGEGAAAAGSPGGSPGGGAAPGAPARKCAGPQLMLRGVPESGRSAIAAVLGC